MRKGIGKDLQAETDGKDQTFDEPQKAWLWIDSTDWSVSRMGRPRAINKNIEQKNKKKKCRKSEEWYISNKIKPLH